MGFDDIVNTGFLAPKDHKKGVDDEVNVCENKLIGVVGDFVGDTAVQGTIIGLDIICLSEIGDDEVSVELYIDVVVRSGTCLVFLSNFERWLQKD